VSQPIALIQSRTGLSALTRAILGRGALAGLIGGLVFAAALARLDRAAGVTLLIGPAPLGIRWAVVRFALHLVIAAGLGAGFAGLIRDQRSGPGETLFWGLAYGFSWWFLGSLTVLPLISTAPGGWSVAAAHQAFPLLLGHLIYGLTTALVLIGLSRRPGTGPVRGRARAARAARAVLPGLAAGIVATWLLTATLPGSGPVLASGNGAGMVFGLSAAAGLGYALLFPVAAGSSRAVGPATVQGAGYGFLLWVLVPLTAVPLLREGGLFWTGAAVQARLATLPAYVLLGAFIAALYTGQAWLTRLLLAAPAERADADEEGVGARTLRAVGWGATAGVIGGLLFTVIMVQIGYLSTVAGLVGSNFTGVGLAVHLSVSVILGASYGLFFRRQSYDLVSGVGWGVAYGFLWWVLGGLSILPLALGGDLQWGAGPISAAFPSLVGHLVYGAGLGAVFHGLEARHDPWWIPRARVAAGRAAAIGRRTDRQRSAPAVWALVVPMAVTVIVVLGRP
jgi:uncharacterized membrane protein YagU involved in acid resistance